jgi:hypothetical protein
VNKRVRTESLHSKKFAASSLILGRATGWPQKPCEALESLNKTFLNTSQT